VPLHDVAPSAGLDGQSEVQTAVDRLGHETAQRRTILLGDDGACLVRELAARRGGAYDGWPDSS
jgi:hypothetical protein